MTRQRLALILSLPFLSRAAHGAAACDARTRAQVCGKISNQRVNAMSTGDLLMLKFQKKDCGCPAKDPYASDWGSYDATRDEADTASASVEPMSKKVSEDDLRMIQERIRTERPKRVSAKERNKQVAEDFQRAFGAPEMRPASRQPSALVREHGSGDKANASTHEETLARLLANGQCFSKSWISLASGKTLVEKVLASNGVKGLGERIEDLSQGKRKLATAPTNAKIFALPAGAERIPSVELWLLEASNPKLALFMAAKDDTVYLNCLDLNTDGDKVRRLMAKKADLQSERAAQERRDLARAKRQCDAKCAHFESNRCFTVGSDNAKVCQEATAQLGSCSCDVREASQAANCAPSCAQISRCSDSGQREDQLLLGILPESLDRLCRSALESVRKNACSCVN